MNIWKYSESRVNIYQQVDYRQIPVKWCLQRAAPPCSSITFSRSCLPPFSFFPHVGSASVGSHSRRFDSSPALCLVFGGGFCPVRRASVDSSLALSVGSAGSIPHRLPPPALPVAPLRPPLPPVALVGKSGGNASPHFWIAVFYSLAPSGRFKRAKKPLFD